MVCNILWSYFSHSKQHSWIFHSFVSHFLTLMAKWSTVLDSFLNPSTLCLVCFNTHYYSATFWICQQGLLWNVRWFSATVNVSNRKNILNWNPAHTVSVLTSLAFRPFLSIPPSRLSPRIISAVRDSWEACSTTPFPFLPVHTLSPGVMGGVWTVWGSLAISAANVQTLQIKKKK